MNWDQMAGLSVENGWDSPRISFSFNLSQTDRTSPEKPKRGDAIGKNCATEFEFCRASNFAANSCKILSYADELFVDGKLLPPIRPLESQQKTFSRHLSLENSRRPSPVRFASFPASKMENAADAVKSSDKPSFRWKDYYICVVPFSGWYSARKRKSKPCSDAPRYRSSKSLKEREISKPCKTAGSRSANKLVDSHIPEGTITRDLSYHAKNYMPERGKGRFIEQYNPKSFDSLLPQSPMAEGLFKSNSISNIHTETGNGRFKECYSPKSFDSLRLGRAMADGLLKSNANSNIQIERGNGRFMEGYSLKAFDSPQPRRAMSKGLVKNNSNSSIQTERGNGRFMESYSPKIFDSPHPGRPIGKSLLKTNSNSNIQNMNMRVSTVLNVGPFGGITGPALFGLSVFSKRESKRSVHSASGGYIDR